MNAPMRIRKAPHLYAPLHPWMVQFQLDNSVDTRRFTDWDAAMEYACFVGEQQLLGQAVSIR